MRPTRLLLTWLGVLLGLSILLGALVALQVKVPDALHSVTWGLLLALLLLALLDASRLRRRPSPRVRRQMPGSLALGRWGGSAGNPGARLSPAVGGPGIRSCA